MGLFARVKLINVLFETDDHPERSENRMPVLVIVISMKLTKGVSC